MDSDMGAATAAATVIVIIIYAIALAFAWVVMGILYHFLFKKIGIASWRAWVPFVNVGAILQVGGYSAWWAAAIIVPGLNIVTMIFQLISLYRIGKGLKMDDALNILGLVLGFWTIAALVVPGPYDHRLTGAQTVQPEQLEAIAAGGLVDPGVGAAYGQAYGAPQPGYAQPAQHAYAPPAQTQGYAPPAQTQGYAPPAQTQAPAQTQGYTPPAQGHPQQPQSPGSGQQPGAGGY